VSSQFAVDLVFNSKGLGAINDATAKLNKVQNAAKGATNNIRPFTASTKAATTGVKGLGAAIATSLAPLLTLATAAAAAGKAINVAFERQAAEQKLKNFTSSTEEYNIALALAAETSQKFGLSQTEALTSLADMQSRLKGLGFGLKEVSEIQQGFQAIVLQSGTSAEDAAGAFLQLSQALGSGRLQGDELRSILERMPTLAQRIADSMGVSTAKIRELGAAGELTSDIIQKALAEAAAGADGMTNKLSASQAAMKAFGQAADRAFAAAGAALAPVVIPAIEAATWATQELAKWWDYLAAEIFPKFMSAIAPLQEAMSSAFSTVDIQAVVTVIQNGMIMAIETLIGYVGNLAKVAATVVNAFQALANTPVFKFIAEQVGAVAEKLGLTNSKVEEFETAQKKVTEETAKGVENYSAMPPKIQDAAAAQKQLTASMKEADQVAKARLSALDQEAQIASARFEAERAINGVLLQQAERRLQGAKSAEEQLAAAQQVYELTMSQAKLEYEATLAQIEAMVRKTQLSKEAAELKYQEIQAAMELARAQGQSTAGYEKALAAQSQAVELAGKMVETAEAIAVEQRRGAEAVYEGAKASAQAAFEQNKVFQATEGAAGAAGTFASNMSQAASQAERAAAAMSKIEGFNTGTGSTLQAGQAVTVSGTASIAGISDAALEAAYPGGAQAIAADTAGTAWWSAQIKWNEFVDKAAAAQKELDDAASAMERATEQAALDAKSLQYANSGFKQASSILANYSKSFVNVAKTTPGDAMASYGSGGMNQQVNIQTGPVTQMDGVNYVTQGDLQNATASAAKQGANMALQQLQNNPGARRAVGI
jgi:tape measure domain-containing protein